MTTVEDCIVRAAWKDMASKSLAPTAMQENLFTLKTERVSTLILLVSRLGFELRFGDFI